MLPGSRCVRAGALALLFSLAGVSVGHATCPVNQGVIGLGFGCAPFTSTAPTVTWSGRCLTGSGTLKYDLTQGTLSVTADGATEGIENTLQTADDFVLNGPSGPNLIEITAVLTGSSVLCGEFKLYSGTDRDSTFSAGFVRLRIVLHHPVGEHFTIGAFAEACGVGYTGQATGTIGFTALPPGYSLTSCQGYAGAVVPVRSLTWGRLKTFYH